MEIQSAIDKVQNYIAENALCGPGDTLLLAVSGGKDSACMFELFKKSGYDFQVAHVNYRLRSTDSDLDAEFVNKMCTDSNIPFHLKTVSDDELAALHSGNLQGKARRIRYQWFAEVRKAQGLSYIVTAHHLDDAIETFLLHCLRGSGLHGLTGMPVKRGHIIRPMLAFSHEEIAQIVDDNEISYREDASNQTLKYKRNRLRLIVLPEFAQIDAKYRERFRSTFGHLTSQRKLFDAMIADFHKQHCHKTDDGFSVNIAALNVYSAPDTLLYELVRTHGFSHSQCEAIIADDMQTGGKFVGSTVTMYRNRSEVVVAKSPGKPDNAYAVQVGSSASTSNGVLDIEATDRPQSFDASKRNIEYIRADRGDQFALRRWQPGDTFVPLGMEGRQKIQDFLVNIKIPLPAKQDVWVLTSDDEIVWVVGHRLSDNWKLAPDAKHALMLRWSAGG